eukprot:4102247-Amphidinium_carterae.1
MARCAVIRFIFGLVEDMPRAADRAVTWPLSKFIAQGQEEIKSAKTDNESTNAMNSQTACPTGSPHLSPISPMCQSPSRCKENGSSPQGSTSARPIFCPIQREDPPPQSNPPTTHLVHLRREELAQGELLGWVRRWNQC